MHAFAIKRRATTKRKVSEMEEDSVFVGKVFGIITDAKERYFMECSLDDQDRLRFKLSKPVTVVYDSKNMGDNVERRSPRTYCMVVEGGAKTGFRLSK
jgi:hypothetical protein